MKEEAVQKATPVVRDQQYVLEAIRAHCRQIGMVFDQTGRVEKIEENLVSFVSNIDAIILELGRGQGGELNVVRGERPKFHSIHSSACLCVNSFALMKAHPQQVKLFGFDSFSIARFEEKLPTGISIPNIDLYLENDRVIVGVESKYTETLTPALPNWADSKTGIGNQQKYVNRLSEISVVPEGFEDGILRHYIGVKEEFHLDVAQLIKHALGLLRRAKEVGKKPILAYLYWEPLNQLKIRKLQTTFTRAHGFSIEN